VCDGINNYGGFHWNGAICIQRGMIDLLEKQYNQDPLLTELEIDLRRNIVLICEHWKLYVQKVDIFSKQYTIPNCAAILQEMNKILHCLEKVKNLILKYTVSNEKSILLRAIQLLETNTISTHDCLYSLRDAMNMVLWDEYNYKCLG